MSNKVNEVIKALSASFRKKFDDYKGLYLFGVFLDGEEHEDEDIELAAIFEVEDKAKRELIWPIIGKLETELEVCIDLYPFTMESFKKEEDIYEEVMKEGIFYNELGIKQGKGLAE